MLYSYQTPEQRRGEALTFWAASAVFVALLTLTSAYHNRYALTDDRAVKAILGEAEGESYKGKVFLAHALVNRKTLAGVQGYHRGHNAPRKAVIDAALAWNEAKKGHKTYDPTKGAQHWLNPKEITGQVSWVRNCQPTASVGRHTFFRCP